MLDMGFIHDVKKIVALAKGRRQTLLFSATMPPDIARLAAGIAVHVLPRAGREEPFHQRDPADPERIVEILARPRTVPVDRDRKARDSEFRHTTLAWFGVPSPAPPASRRALRQ